MAQSLPTFSVNVENMSFRFYVIGGIYGKTSDDYFVEEILTKKEIDIGSGAEKRIVYGSRPIYPLSW